MAKNRNMNQKKKERAVTAMEISSDVASQDLPQAMDVSEINTTGPALGVKNRKINKGPSLRRSKKLRKLKAVEKAISNSERLEEMKSKKKNKCTRIQSAKSFYD